MAGQIALNKPSGGQLILAPEDGTSSETVTIPSVGVGKVLQVQRTSYGGGSISTTVVAHNPSVATGVSCSITPTSTTSKIVVSVSFNQQHTGSANQGTTWGVARNGTVITNHNNSGYIEYDAVSTNWHNTVGTTFVDAPNTTSALSYEIYLGNYNGGTAYIRDWGIASIVLMEVAA